MHACMWIFLLFCCMFRVFGQLLSQLEGSTPINLPLMAFATNLVLTGISLGPSGKVSPEGPVSPSAAAVRYYWFQ
ncbi:hypothetical protein E1A91_D07G103600v1 [Gossypium mustelinum]|uniref:PGG domain-containing protein n=1 Tax=Gossypium mustelinum TaxID=34275 RepID=A0A5D2U651_GOSMU|nr:hypothetical protein E1A91_D07G103600v1 [Gossypium mustelinum]